MVIFAREKKKLPVKNFNFVPVKTDFVPVKKTKKVPVKKKSGREKSEKWAKKWAWKKKSAREKNQKKAQKSFHGHFLFSRGKKTLALSSVISEGTL